MIDSINRCTVADDVRLRSRNKSDIFVISETHRYDDFIRRIFTRRNIVIAYGQQNTIGALIILQNDGYQNIYAYLESNIDTSLYADLLPKILTASNWSNQSAKQELVSLSAENQQFDLNSNTNTSIDTPSESSADHDPT